MITREGTQETSSVEFVSATTVWESTSNSEGYIQPDYLLSLAARNEAVEQATASRLPHVTHHRFLDRCPIYPHLTDIEQLRSLRAFDRTMDALIKCQRGIKEKQSWVTFMDKWMESPHQSERCYPGGVNLADDTLISVWVKGKTTNLVPWYLVEAYMPCFFISELPRSLRGVRMWTSFLEGTDLELLLNNKFKRIASARGMKFTDTELYSPLQANLRPE
jgi:hypothetical protein